LRRSAATALTPIAAHLGLPWLLAARALMGVGEGVAMPAMNNMLSRWVPVKERSRCARRLPAWPWLRWAA
jgi:ACS family sodium-dependent inorganic phosphate cotransporter